MQIRKCTNVIFFYIMMLKKIRFYHLENFHYFTWVIVYDNSLSRCLFNSRKTIITRQTFTTYISLKSTLQYCLYHRLDRVYVTIIFVLQTHYSLRYNIAYPLFSTWRTVNSYILHTFTLLLFLNYIVLILSFPC